MSVCSTKYKYEYNWKQFHLSFDKINLKSAYVGGNKALGVFCIPVASAKTTKHLAAIKILVIRPDL